MNDPKRREQRRTHLDASVVPVERALLARADALTGAAADPDGTAYGAFTFGGPGWDQLTVHLGGQGGTFAGAGGGGGAGYGGGQGGGGGGGGSVTVSGQNATAIGGGGGRGGSASGGTLAWLIAAEFRALAEELHWW